MIDQTEDTGESQGDTSPEPSQGLSQEGTPEPVAAESETEAAGGESADTAAAGAVPGGAVPGGAVPGDTAAARGRTPWWRRYALPAVAAIVLVAGVFLWWRAATDDQLRLAETRDEVLIQATQHIETMNTLDYRDVDGGLAAWQDVTTGTLHDQLTQVGDDERQLLADQKKISTGKVVDAAVFDLGDGTATVVASVEVTVKDDAKPDDDPSVKRNRFSANLVDVEGEWLLESLEQVAVNLS